MARVEHDIVEMPEGETTGAMPPYGRLIEWVTNEVEGLTDAQLDVDDLSLENEWMWWSIRRQVSHIAWDSLVFTSRRCGALLWPDGDAPEPIIWSHHYTGQEPKYDRVLDENLYWQVPDLIAKMTIGIGWLERVVSEQPIQTLRADVTSVRRTHFLNYAITTLPRGAGDDPDRPGYLQYTLEGSLWMVFYEMLSHVRTIQRLKLHQGLPLGRRSRESAISDCPITGATPTRTAPRWSASDLASTCSGPVADPCGSGLSGAVHPVGGGVAAGVRVRIWDVGHILDIPPPAEPGTRGRRDTLERCPPPNPVGPSNGSATW